jgi:Domain of unknown function (DUF4160)
VPAIFRFKGFRFHFFSNEGDPREPVHVHVSKAGADAKYWLLPEVSVAYNRGLSAGELSEMMAVASQRRDEILRAWDEHFS